MKEESVGREEKKTQEWDLEGFNMKNSRNKEEPKNDLQDGKKPGKCILEAKVWSPGPGTTRYQWQVR